MAVLLGFDPGGKGSFGWCVAYDNSVLPLQIVASGVSNHAASAVATCLSALPAAHDVLAAGIDAPLMWSRSGRRSADVRVRNAIRKAGAPHVGGTVQEVNSLRGACLVQGFLAAIELREHFPGLPLTEAHPKALRWLCMEAREFISSSEHERDAALSAFTAWALINRPLGWSDLYAEKANSYPLVSMPLSYFMPISAG